MHPARAAGELPAAQGHPRPVGEWGDRGRGRRHAAAWHPQRDGAADRRRRQSGDGRLPPASLRAVAPGGDADPAGDAGQRARAGRRPSARRRPQPRPPRRAHRRLPNRWPRRRARRRGIDGRAARHRPRRTPRRRSRNPNRESTRTRRTRARSCARSPASRPSSSSRSSRSAWSVGAARATPRCTPEVTCRSPWRQPGSCARGRGPSSARLAASRRPRGRLFEQLILPQLRQRNPQARQQAVELLRELSALGGELRGGARRQALRHHLDG